MRTRNHDWFDSVKAVPVYGVQVFHDGKWCHAAINGKPIFCDTPEERAEQRKRLKRLLAAQGKVPANTRAVQPAP
jgi:hypothetical protein